MKTALEHLLGAKIHLRAAAELMPSNDVRAFISCALAFVESGIKRIKDEESKRTTQATSSAAR